MKIKAMIKKEGNEWIGSIPGTGISTKGLTKKQLLFRLEEDFEALQYFTTENIYDFTDCTEIDL